MAGHQDGKPRSGERLRHRMILDLVCPGFIASSFFSLIVGIKNISIVIMKIYLRLVGIEREA